MTIAVGAIAPDFALPGTDGTGSAIGRRDYSLSEFDGMVRVLIFYPADASPVCTVQLNTYTADIGQFDAVGAQVLALSPQSVAEHERFAAEEGGFAFPLLADVDHVAGRGLRRARAHGLLPPLGVRDRCLRDRALRPPVDGGADLPPHRGAAGRGRGRHRLLTPRRAPVAAPRGHAQHLVRVRPWTTPGRCCSPVLGGSGSPARAAGRGRRRARPTP